MKLSEYQKQMCCRDYKQLKDRFIIPPLSTFDKKQGYWIKRYRQWRALIKNATHSREMTLTNGRNNNIINCNTNNVSLIDPVMIEALIYWFTPHRGSNIIDPMAGDHTEGIVASRYNNNFTGIEIRPEQVANNIQNTIGIDNIKYICDDGRNILNHIKAKSQDLILSCPPYYNLEIYSNLENDASNQNTYQQFLDIITEVYSQTITTLKENRFACVIVGDVRDKYGFYFNLPSHIIDIFQSSGCRLYNNIVLLEPIGTPALLAAKSINKSRKVRKVHQNVLVFYKPSESLTIQDEFKSLDDSEFYQFETNEMCLVMESNEAS